LLGRVTMRLGTAPYQLVAQMTKAKKHPSSRLAKFERCLETTLKLGEVLAVIILTAIVLMTAVGAMIWTAFCPTIRLPMILGNLNVNWKACLLLLVPLFYRTIQAVLQRIKKWPWGMESQEPEDEKTEKTPKEQQKSSQVQQRANEEEA
jgi:hypothetical protein